MKYVSSRLYPWRTRFACQSYRGLEEQPHWQYGCDTPSKPARFPGRLFSEKGTSLVKPSRGD